MMALKQAAAFVVLFALSGSPAKSDPKLDASAYTFMSILFPALAGHQFGYGTKWMKMPSPAQVEEVLPVNAKNAGRTQWSCAIKISGFLDDCELQTEWPSGEGFADAARKLLPLVQVSQEDVSESRNAQSRAVVEVNLEDDSRMVLDIPGDCPPPFCTAIPPPPPPSMSRSPG